MRHALAALALALALLPADAAERRYFGAEEPFVLEDLPESRLRSDLERLPPEIRAFAIERLNAIGFPPADVATLRVDASGMAYYADPAPP